MHLLTFQRLLVDVKIKDNITTKARLLLKVVILSVIVSLAHGSVDHEDVLRNQMLWLLWILLTVEMYLIQMIQNAAPSYNVMKVLQYHLEKVVYNTFILKKKPCYLSICDHFY